MSSNDAIVFENVTKRYSKYDGILKVKNFLDRIKNGQFGSKLVREEDFYALKNVSFTLKKGERLGIIGPNGAGKSTTLKLVNRIAFPTEGNILVNGKVGGLIEMGAGFQEDLSGRENVYLNTALQGFSRKETDQMFDRIVEIAELEHFIDVPIKRYSSGMKVRLGFAVALSAVPDIVLLDEVLAVGDARFKKKSMNLVNEYLEGRTLLFVSHSMSQVYKVCERCIVLHKGEMICDAPVREAVKIYESIQVEDAPNSESVVVPRNIKRGFSEAPAVVIESMKLIADNGDESRVITKGTRPLIQLKFDFAEVLGSLNVRTHVKRTHMGRFAETLGGIRLETKVQSAKDDELVLSFDTTNLKAGEYILEVIPEFSKQSKKSSIVAHREKFEIVSSDEESDIGLLDLSFQVETSSRTLSDA